MCGRYYRRSDKQRIGDAFNISDLPSSLIISDADYNVAPTTFQPVIRNDKETGERELVLMRWGLVPFLRSSSQMSKASRRSTPRPRTSRRVLPGAHPFKSDAVSFRRTDFTSGRDSTRRLNSLLHSGWGWCAIRVRRPVGRVERTDREWLQSFSILTTDANELTSVHTRMPVILHPKDYSRWLEREPVGRRSICSGLSSRRPWMRHLAIRSSGTSGTMGLRC